MEEVNGYFKLFYGGTPKPQITRITPAISLEKRINRGLRGYKRIRIKRIDRG